MRLFTATLATETNTFSPIPTSIENYRESVFYRPGEHPTDAPRMCTAPLMVGIGEKVLVSVASVAVKRRMMLLRE